MDHHNLQNPWVGLNSYKEGEALYGRNDEIRDLVQCVIRDSVTVLYGRSGIGKSSLLNAGVIPSARRKGFTPVVIRLSHVEEYSYTGQIIESILQSKDIIAKEVVPRLTDNNPESLYEYLHRHTFHNRDGARLRLLLIFDQFEEIFTLQSNEAKKKVFFSELADVINDIPPAYLQRYNYNNGATKSENDEQLIDAGNITSLLRSLKSEKSHETISYVNDNDIHLVLTLREDFLSEFEYYSAAIPALKQNRFGLRPLNEEQAAIVIEKPVPGLVSRQVAKLIIEKVTKRDDFKLDGIPEIEVDSAVLSLFLNRLFDKMVKDGDNIISQNLVERYSDEIIANFYADAIHGLPSKAVYWIEHVLVNEDGRRDNRAESTVIRDSGLTRFQLHEMIEDKKLLRQFPHGGSNRIELIHDVLCPVIVKHRQLEEEKLRIEHFRQMARHDRRILILRMSLISVFVLTAVSLFFLWYIRHNTSVKSMDQKQNIVVSVEEDASVKDIDFWRATLSVKGIYESAKDSLLLRQYITKADAGKTYTVSADSCLSLVFSLDFGDFADIGKYENKELMLSASEIMESPYVKLPVARNLPDLYPWKGRLLLDVENAELPVENAIVMMNDVVTVTDSTGHFELMIEGTPSASLQVAKNGLGVFETAPVFKELYELDTVNIYRVIPADSLAGFNRQLEAMDTVNSWNYSTVGPIMCANQGSANGLYVKFHDGSEDRLKMYWKKGEAQDDRILLSGYFYFINEKAELDKNGLGKYACYVGTGYIDRKLKRDDNNAAYRNFEFRGFDAASNLRTITGKYYSVRGAGKYTGDVTSNKRQIGTFGHAL